VRACACSDDRLLNAFSFLFFSFNSADVDVYLYREQDIFLMTDEEVNKGTEMWPSALNIVRFVPPWGCVIPHALTTPNL
jgi:hypothetical protein